MRNWDDIPLTQINCKGGYHLLKFPLIDYLFRYFGYSLADTEKDEDQVIQLPEHLQHQLRGNRALDGQQ